MEFTLDYLQLFYLNVKLAFPLLAFAILLIVPLGRIVGIRESKSGLRTTNPAETGSVTAHTSA